MEEEKNGTDKNVGSIEDIKILEEMLKIRRKQKEIIECAGGYCGNCNQDIKALENAIQTIKAYKELKQENRKLSKANETYIKSIQNITSVLMNDYIEKTLVEETLEKLTEQYKIALEENSTKAFILKCQIEILQELLEGE